MKTTRIGVLVVFVEVRDDAQHPLCIPQVLKWWVATLKWVAGPEFLTLDSMRTPKFRH